MIIMILSGEIDSSIDSANYSLISLTMVAVERTLNSTRSISIDDKTSIFLGTLGNILNIRNCNAS